MPLERGAVIGRYVVLDRVGEGAMGVVYAAYDPDLDRKLALKVIRPDPRSWPVTAGGEGQRLLREAQAMARVSHPAVVGVYDVGSVGDEVFLAMELVDGLTLQEWLAARPRRAGEILDAFIAAGAGLQAAHEAGLVHRDFKPANVLVRSDGRVQVTDFGLARAPLKQAEPGSASDASRPSLSSAVTMAGVVLGTPRYMAPEQRNRAAVDARADQYAFCLALWEALTGKLPPGLAPPETVPLEPTTLPSRPLAAGQLRRPLRAALERGLSPSPAERFESMAALLAALRRARRRDRRALAAGAVLAVALASTSAIWLTRAPPCDEGRRLAGLWDAARRAEIAGAFEKARGPAGTEASTFAARSLDEMAAAWTAGAQDSCQATRAARQSSEVAALRSGCLEQSLADLAAVTAVLARADAQTVDRAYDAIATWSGVARCADVPALLGSEPPALPPAAAAAAAGIRARLAETNALSGVGKNAEAMELARAQVEAVRGLDSPTLLAEALYSLAQSQERSAQTETALATAREAFPLALRSGHRRMSVRLAATLAFYLGARQARFEEAHFWARVGQALIGPHPGPEALTLDNNIAAIYFAQGRYEEAVALHQQVYERRLRTQGERHPATFTSLTSLALSLQLLGRHEEAMAINQRLLALRVEVQGPNHRHVATVIGNLADNQRDLGLTAEAVANYRRAFQLRYDKLGPEHRDTSISELLLAAALTSSGRAEEALPLIAHADAALHKRKGGTPGVTAAAKCFRGNTLGALGRWAEALPHHRACLAEFRTTYGDAHPETTQAMREASESLLRTGHREEMLAMIDPMLAAEKAASGETSVLYSRALAQAAEQLLAAGALDRAEKALAAAEPLVAAQESPESRYRAFALVLRAELELARGRTDDAATAARAALAMPHLGERAPAYAARAKAALGRALLHGPDASQAAELLAQARNFFSADPNRYDRELAGISAAR